MTMSSVIAELAVVERAALARGPRTRAGGMNGLGDALTDLTEWRQSPAGIAWGVASTVSMAASAYHGYKRNDSVGWALWWGLCGGLFPVVVPVIGVAQGFGKRAKR